MNTRTIWLTLLVVAALVLPLSAASAQDRMAQIESAKRTLDQNPTEANRLNLSKLQYDQGLDDLKAGDMGHAIDNLQAAVWTLEDGKGQPAETNPSFQEARYALAYALNANNNAYEALLVLEQMTNADPNNSKAQYLLGVTLVNIPGEQSMQRAVDVMTKLGQDGSKPYNTWGEHAATRLAYNLSTLAAAQGDAARALSTLTGVTDTIGADKGGSDEENAKIKFAMGIYQRDSGDVNGAIQSLEALHEMNASFQTSSGVSASGVLANMYYAGGLEQLGLEGESASRTALTFFEDAQKVGDDGLDLHHGKAVAYTRLGEGDNAVAELQQIVQRDASYYDKIKK